MRIIGIDNLTSEELSDELFRGGRFVIFKYCVSVILLTFNRPSNIYYLRPGESAFARGFGFSMISLLFGWWGIPWGPIFTIGALVTNFSGGRDVTVEVLNSLRQGSVAPDGHGIE